MKDTNSFGVLNFGIRGYGRHSVFFKLLAVLVGTVLITYLAVGGFYRSFWNASARADAHLSLIHYSELLSNEIGTPPDTALAASLASRLGLAIGVKGPDFIWLSPDFSRPIFHHLRESSSGDSIQILLSQGRLWAMVPKGEYTFIYGSHHRQPLESLGQEWMALLGVLFVAWLLAWVELRRLLWPVRGLAEGVKAVEAGNLDVRVSEKGKDELSALARSFNAMTKSLKERLRARDQLLLDVSHELRSPLTRMRVALEMAEPGSAVDSLQEEVSSLGKMVSEILETERLNSQTGQVKREPSDLVKLMTDKVAKFAGHTPGITWHPVDMPLVPLDTERIRLVLRNIIDNALKYGKTATRPIEISLRKEGGFAVLDVQDFGPGIPEADQPLVFEPFYRVDRSRSRTSGYGLGLSLCKRIVEAHGGSISLYSKMGEGTRMTIKLPLQ
jgi:signal transduction histidine kinase